MPSLKTKIFIIVTAEVLLSLIVLVNGGNGMHLDEY